MLLMLETESVRLISVSTTAFKEEDLLLITDLDEQEILDVIEPIVFAERSNDGVPYYNDDLFIALKNAYPSNFIQYYTEPKRMVI